MLLLYCKLIVCCVAGPAPCVKCEVMSDSSTVCPWTTGVYFVPGLGGSDPTNFKAPLRQLVESIFGIQFRPRVAEILTNQCRFGLKPDETLIAKIKEIARDRSCCEHVSLVWFGHSHGAKMVCDAYKQLQGTVGFDEIKNSTAIICIGGASLATDDLAKVTS